MKKIICGFLSAIVLCALCVFPTSAETVKKNDDYTLYELQNSLLEYFDNENISIKIDSEEYRTYLLEQMMFETDTELTKHPQYSLIRTYAAAYLNKIDGTNLLNLQTRSNISIIDSTGIGDKTIGQIKQEVLEADRQADLRGMQPAPRSSYNRTAAINYARIWAYSHNPDYSSFSSDCTNYVSQCLVAGGVPKTAPYPFSGQGLMKTSGYWYCYGYYDMSTSFIQVSDFYGYWRNHTTTYTYTSNSAARNGMSGGDVVFLADKGSGLPYHAIFITQGGTNATYCGHTNFRLDQAVSSITDNCNYIVHRY